MDSLCIKLRSYISALGMLVSKTSTISTVMKHTVLDKINDHYQRLQCPIQLPSFILNFKFPRFSIICNTILSSFGRWSNFKLFDILFSLLIFCDLSSFLRDFFILRISCCYFLWSWGFFFEFQNDLTILFYVLTHIILLVTLTWIGYIFRNTNNTNKRQGLIN